MGHTLATMKGAYSLTKRNRKRALWERIKRNIQNSGLTTDQVQKVIVSIRPDLEELIEIASVEKYVCGYHDGMQKMTKK